MSRTDRGNGHGPQRAGQPARLEPESAPPQHRANNDGPPSVLIVEDEEPIADALAYLVEEAGYVPLRAAHGKEALELARQHHPKLVITDLMMPIMNGRELIAALRADAAADGSDPPVIILTTAGGFSHAQSAAADVVLRKPFDISEIETLLTRYLGPRRDSH